MIKREMGIYDMVLLEEVINPSTLNTTNEHHDHDGDYECQIYGPGVPIPPISSTTSIYRTKSYGK